MPAAGGPPATSPGSGYPLIMRMGRAPGAVLAGVLVAGCAASANASVGPPRVDADVEAPLVTAAPLMSAETSLVGTASLPGLRGAVVVIDPGHNGANRKHPEIINRLVDAGNGRRKACDTTGTQTAGGYAEAAFTWDLANRLAARLRAAGARVVLTRPSNGGVGPCITQRAAIGNRAAAAAGRGVRVIGISLHADGGPAGGYGFHVIEPGRVQGNGAIVAPSRQLGTAVRNAFRAGTGEPYSTYTGRSGVTVRTDLGGLNLSRIPKVFIECGNMRNRADAVRLGSRAWRNRAADALARGLSAYLAA
jgi:N-acetylmuramoyl-L-alanine amidase